jgi:hypothetical protein
LRSNSRVSRREAIGLIDSEQKFINVVCAMSNHNFTVNNLCYGIAIARFFFLKVLCFLLLLLKLLFGLLRLLECRNKILKISNTGKIVKFSKSNVISQLIFLINSGQESSIHESQLFHIGLRVNSEQLIFMIFAQVVNVI